MSSMAQVAWVVGTILVLAWLATEPLARWTAAWIAWLDSAPTNKRHLTEQERAMWMYRYGMLMGLILELFCLFVSGLIRS